MTNSFDGQITSQYTRENLYESILKGLKNMGKDLDNITRNDIQGVDEFHVRGSEVSKKMATYAQIKGTQVLDVGCGIGGPARMLRTEYDCEVTGLDLNETYIETARKLTRLVGIRDGIEFVTGNALNLPFEAKHFDLVWTQHVQMNVEHKVSFYSEIYRVLRPKGKLIHYEILSKGSSKINYPVPWADEQSISFLVDREELEKIIESVGFKKIRTEDETMNGIEFFENLLARIRTQGPPEVGLNLLMGAQTKTKISNLLTGLQSGSLELQSGLFVK